jgi:TetR/AcrR family transcriptional regulator, transcriptional repressor for nem operon
MPRTSDKHQKLVKAADRLFHRNGLAHSSIAGVAAEAGVPAGNVYYYFKTKDEMVAAVVGDRNRRMDHLFGRIEREPDPLRRLVAFVERYDEVCDDRAAFGCPVGNLCQEASYIGGALAEQAGSGFTRILDWLAVQFDALGFVPAESRYHAVHLLAGLQGAMLIAHTFGDPAIINAETRQLRFWLRDIGRETLEEPA